MSKRKRELEDRINALRDKQLFQVLSPIERKELYEDEGDYVIILAEEDKVKEEAKSEKSREMKNRRRRGKYGEKKLAKEVGGRRDGGVGRKDVIGGLFSYEIKTLKKIPSSIINLMAQAERLKKQGTVAVGVFRCNSPRQEYFIVERNDWLSLHGK